MIFQHLKCYCTTGQYDIASLDNDFPSLGNVTLALGNDIPSLVAMDNVTPAPRNDVVALGNDNPSTGKR